MLKGRGGRQEGEEIGTLVPCICGRFISQRHGGHPPYARNLARRDDCRGSPPGLAQKGHSLLNDDGRIISGEALLPAGWR